MRLQDENGVGACTADCDRQGKGDEAHAGEDWRNCCDGHGTSIAASPLDASSQRKSRETLSPEWMGVDGVGKELGDGNRCDALHLPATGCGDGVGDDETFDGASQQAVRTLWPLNTGCTAAASMRWAPCSSRNSAAAIMVPAARDLVVDEQGHCDRQRRR